MGLETATYVDDLVATNPTGGDPKSEGDQHLRLIKAVLQATFPDQGQALWLHKLMGFRLSLTNGTPVTTSDVTAATTVYAVPCESNLISLYNGTDWVLRRSSGMSVGVPAVATQMYDVFCYDNAGVPTLELTAWTNDSTRATALAYQDGVLVKSGATTRRYLGSFRTAASGQTEDSVSKRFLWNYYNRRDRKLYKAYNAGSWSYASSTIRQANADAANQVEFVVGVAEEALSVTIRAFSDSSVGPGSALVGYDSTTAVPAASEYQAAASAGQTLIDGSVATLLTVPAAGRHYVAMLEKGFTNFYSAVSEVPVLQQGGLLGLIRG